MKTNHIKYLRKQCKRLMVDLEEENKIRSQPRRQLARDIGVNYGSLAMALTGYRSGRGSEEILSKLHDHLQALKNN